MKALVVCGSMRKNGNTNILADEFIKGAKEAGHEAEKVSLRDLTFGDCFGCRACHGNGGICVQKDDIGNVLEKMKSADVIVLASPMYYFTWTGLMKRFLDRTYPLLPILKNKDFYLITLGGVPDKKYMANILSDFSMYVGCFKEFNQVGCRVAGNVIATSALKPGAVRESKALEEAYELGKNI
ncbi:MAG: flavodoxin family protein [Selenomonadaceae bacterium]|nr:flavodoxin family protein [Selenomonadaceae bacterium]